MTCAGELVDNKYEVLGLIGEGGMSRVWLARDRRLNKLWAVKEVGRAVRDANNELVAQSLVAEANLMKRLDHPALPRIVDIVEDKKTIYVIMDYVEGESLKSTMQRRGRLATEQEAVDWGVQLCDVLEYLHTRTPPIIYRDMKPGNVMVREDGTVKLIDFGIAREYKEGGAADTKILGTRGYAAPEQFLCRSQTDARSDVYSLGVTLYALLTGRSVADDPVLRPLREVDPTLSEGLEHVLAKATKQDPDARYQSCAEMRRDLVGRERLTASYRARQRRKIARFNALRGLATGAVALGAACAAAGLWLRASTYEAKIELARAASAQAAGDGESEAERCYRQAIAVDPLRPEAYLELINSVYKADQDFTIAEAGRLSELMAERARGLAGTEAYARLCYDIGTLYYVYFEQAEEGDGRPYALSGAAQAAPWFRRAASSYDERTERGRACALDARERAAAGAYATIGEFYQKLQQALLEGTEGGVYEGYWDSLEEAFALLERDDPAMAQLRLYQLVYRTVASPTHLGGCRRAGVTRQRVRSLLGSVLEATWALGDVAAQSERTRALYDEIVGGVELDPKTREPVCGATRNLEVVFGSAGALAAGGGPDAGEVV